MGCAKGELVFNAFASRWVTAVHRVVLRRMSGCCPGPVKIYSIDSTLSRHGDTIPCYSIV